MGDQAMLYVRATSPAPTIRGARRKESMLDASIGNLRLELHGSVVNEWAHAHCYRVSNKEKENNDSRIETIGTPSPPPLKMD